MKKSVRQLVALTLAFAMAFSCGQGVFAAMDGSQQPPVVTEQPEVAPEPSALPTAMPSASPVPGDETPVEPEPGEGVEPPEQEPSPLPEETVEPTPEPTEETEQSGGETEETPQDVLFPGMPEGFALTEEELKNKRELIDKGMLEDLEKMVPGEDYVAGELVLLTETQEYAEQAAAAYGAALESYEYGVALLTLPEGVTVLDAVRAAADLGNTLPAVSPNQIVELDPVQPTEEELQRAIEAYGVRQDVPEETDWFDWAGEEPMLQPTDRLYQWQHAAVGSYSAWGTTQGKNEVVVAVLDSGVGTNSDVTVKVTKNYYPSQTDLNDHGTHVAGIIGATYDNKIGGSGIAPYVSLMDVRVLDSNGSGTSNVILQGINYAVQNGADIINMSLGSYGYSTAENQAIQNAVNKGVAVIVAAGNDGTNIRCYPAAYDNVICVGALNADDTRASFSNYGDWITISAPGVDIPSTLPNNGFGVMSGTSQATPVVSGVAALYLSTVGDCSGDVNGDGVRNIEDVKALAAALKKAADKCPTAQMGGVVNAEKLMETVIAPPAIQIAVNGKVVEKFSQPIVLKETDEATLSFVTPGETDYCIVYTTDGSMPKLEDGGVTGTGDIYDGKPLNITQEYGMEAGRHTWKAMAINGAGVRSKVVSATFTLQFAASGSIDITGPQFAAKGKTVAYKAVLTDLKGSIVWSVDGAAASAGVTVGGGSLKVPAGCSVNKVTITAALNGNPHIYTTFPVTLREPVTKLELAALNGKTTIDRETSVQLSYTANGGAIAKNQVELTWKSSNAKIATVDEKGLVTPVGKGLVTITATSTDGGKATATIKLTVAQLVKAVSITTNVDVPGKAPQIAWGASVQYKAVVEPANAAVTAVEWSLGGNNIEDVKAAGITLTAAGKLTVPKNAGFYGTVTVVAKSKEAGSTVQGAREIKVVPDTVAVMPMILSGGIRSVYNNKSMLTGVDLYAQAVNGSSYDKNTERQENVAQLKVGGGDSNLLWSSSNEKVATVDQNGLVTAVGKGSASIKITLLDGSNKSATVKVTVLQPVTGITLTAATQPESGNPSIAVGTTVKCTAVVTPATANNKGLTWELVGDDLSGKIKLSTAGALSIAKGTDLGELKTVQVKATAKDGSNTSATLTFNLRSAPVTALTVGLAAGQPDGGRVAYNAKTGAVTGVTLFTQAKSNTEYDTVAGEKISENTITVSAAEADLPVKWTSSNAAIAQVDAATGAITAGAKTGNATIKATALDGSNKSVSIKVTVVDPVGNITLSTTQAGVAAGKTIRYTAALTGTTGAKPTNSKLIWAVDANSQAKGVTVNNGTVKVPATAGSRFWVTVTATAADKSGVVATEKVFVNPLVSGKLWIDPPHNNGKEDWRADVQKGTFMGVTLFTAPVENSVYDQNGKLDENEISLQCYNNDVPVKWSSSKPDIVSVEGYGEEGWATLTAVSAGTAVITVTANDGSGAKVTFKATAIVPASGITITTTAAQDAHSADYGLAPGTSANFKAAFDTAYGKPTNQKVVWKILSNPNGCDVSINATSGKLSVGAKNKTFGAVTIAAYTQDGTNLTAQQSLYILNQRTTTAKAPAELPLYYDGNDGRVYPIKIDGQQAWWSNAQQAQIVRQSGSGAADAASILFVTDAMVGTFTWKSSNPKVAGIVDCLPVYYNTTNGSLTTVSKGAVAVYSVVGNKALPVYMADVCAGTTTGSATVTVTVADGTNKSCSYKITVK